MMNTITMVMLILQEYEPEVPTILTVWEHLRDGDGLVLLAKSRGYKDVCIEDWMGYCVSLGHNKLKNEVVSAYVQLTGQDV